MSTIATLTVSGTNVEEVQFKGKFGFRTDVMPKAQELVREHNTEVNLYYEDEDHPREIYGIIGLNGIFQPIDDPNLP